MKFTQQAGSVMMIRPASFGFNAETAASNAFQQVIPQGAGALNNEAQREFDRMVDLLASHEITVHVFEDEKAPVKPDAVFPNNWISFQPDGTIVLYPMMAVNRRLERRMDIVEKISEVYDVRRVVDLSKEEESKKYLEGTGSIVFDHVNKIAYASRSPRTDEGLVKKICHELSYSAVIFDAVDAKDNAIYHTNVLMCIGAKFAIVCLDAIRRDEDQENLLSNFERTGHKVIAISYLQMEAFAGNMMEVLSVHNESFVLMSQRAFNSLLPGQLNVISQHAEVLPVHIPTIETVGGGSVRCMVAGIHMPKRNAS